MLNRTELEFYSYLILQKIIADLRRLYRQGDTCKCQPIIHNILPQTISRFDQTTFEEANLYSAFCLAFADFIKMGEFTYNNVEPDFSY